VPTRLFIQPAVMKKNLHVLPPLCYRFPLSISLGWIFLGGPLLSAQTATEPPAARGPETTVTLSPFLVEEARDSGYAARDSLAGTRLKTPLADIASQVSVFTPELLEDLALHGPDQVYMYSTNVDTVHEGFTDEGGDNGATRGAIFLNNGNRSRGMTVLTNMRDFFPTSFATDTYNSSRITIASGPNAILFGLASPAGVVDTSPKRAEFRDAYSFGTSYTNVDGYRLEADLNRTLFKRKLAGRFAALKNNDRTFRPGTTDVNNRYFGTLTYKPFARTTVRASVESINRLASRASMVLPRDYITPWWDAGKMGFNNRGITSATPVAQVNAAIAAQGLQGLVIPFTARLTYVYGGTGVNRDSLLNLINTVRTNAAHLQPSVPTENSTPAWSLNRPDIVDPRFNGFGAGVAVEQRGTIRNVFLEQEILKNLVMELGFASEAQRQRLGSFYRPEVLNIEADPNQFLPDGTANPDFRRLFVETDSSGSITYTKSSNARATLAYSPDLRNRSGWLRHLGHYNFGTLYEVWNTENKSQTLRLTTQDNLSHFSAATRNNALDANRIFNSRYYLSSGDLSRPAGARFGNALSFAEPVALSLPSGEQVTYRMWSQDGGFGPGAGTKQKTASTVVNGQGFFLNERLLLYAGYRHDTVDRAQSLTAASRTRKPWVQTNGTVANMGFYPNVEETQYVDWDFSETGESFNWGAIARLLSWFQVHFSDSENFAVQSNTWFTPFGVSIPGSNGKGRDYGFSVRLPNNKLLLRVNRWKNSQVNGRPANLIVVLRNAPISIEQRILEIAPTTPKLGLDLERYGSDSYQVTNTLAATGMDVELIANPSDSWRALINLGKQETVTQLDDTWWRWVEQRLPTWQSLGSGWNIQSISNTNSTTIRQVYEQWVAAYRDPLIATNGSVTDNQRKWRANAVVSHDFREGFMKGWTLGGGGRYRSAPYVGYPVKTLPAGQRVLDLTRPYEGADERYVDAFARYTFRRLPFFGQRARAKVQVNVRNLLDAGGITVMDVKIDGSPKVYRYQTPREIIFSLNVSL
jgi:outer membrane receptor protein involved in Fe transport